MAVAFAAEDLAMLGYHRFVKDLNGLDKEAFLQRIIDTRDNRKLFELFEQMIKMSYGIKSEDGKRFIKNKDATEAFVQSEAYTELLMELMGEDSTNAVLAFVRGIMPLDGLSEAEIDAAVADATAKIDAVSVGD